MPPSRCRPGDAVALSLRCQHAAGGCTTSEAAWTVGAGPPPAAPDPGVLVALDRPCPLHRRLPRAGVAVGAGAQADDLRADRGHRRRPHRVAARGTRRQAQLGLPLHLVARRLAHPLRALPIGPARGGPWTSSTGCARPGIGEGVKVQNLYRVDGGRDITRAGPQPLERLPHSKPVRIGNGAVDQLQLDVYGELLDSAYLYARFGGEISQELWRELHAGRRPDHRAVAASRRVDLGEPRPGAALHVQQADVLGRCRPRAAPGGALRPALRPRALGGGSPGYPPHRDHRGVPPRPALVHPDPGRADPRCRDAPGGPGALPRRSRSPHGVHGAGGRPPPRPRGAGQPVPPRGDRRRRRPRRGGCVPDVLLLAGRRPRPHRGGGGRRSAASSGCSPSPRRSG